jgi:hypothetical protein
MKGKSFVKTTKAFDKRFDAGEDIHDLVDLSRAKVTQYNKKVRITLDIAESLVRDIDRIRERIGVDRGALIKVWIHEKVREANSGE